ncbi:MAG TPA: serine/threonine-protein kinase [Kofleriaceae bacterium]|nr:serine/threonine-protein kinase [Kofleriaceae bacterium]
MTGRVPVSSGGYDNQGRRAWARASAPVPHPAIALEAEDEIEVADLLPEDAAPDSLLPEPGARIGQYEIIRELGRGGMGAVYAARDTKLGRKVAIKFLSSSKHPELSARFILEAKATAQCNHENIIVIHEVGEHAGNPFMVLEYLQGNPLTNLLQDGRKLPPAQAIELMVPVVRALTVAHAHNIVHRDLKPDNIFVTDSGTVKVLDFGIAKLIHGGDDDGALARNAAARAADLGARPPRELTNRGTLIGTLPYMAPEQWGVRGTTVDHQTDVWAVGIMLFEMVAGHHPLAPRQGWDLMVTGVLAEPMPGVRGACPNLSDELADIIDRCLLKPKDQRIASARALLDALEPLLPGRYVRRLRSDESPYAGLKSFQESDAHRFFGRSRDVAAAVARLRDLPLLGIIGPSGVGKSSFVRAGIVPALKASGESWSTIVVRPGRSPMAALAYALTPMVASSASHSTTTASSDLAQQQEIFQRLHAEPGFLGAALRSRARSRNQHILLFVDQFEELYTQVADPRERLAFTACLAGVCDDPTTPLRLVLSLRSDFLDHVSEAPALMAELTHGLHFLAPPNRDGLRDALIQPAEMAGYQFEAPAMIEAMLDHLEHTPGALPLLQFAASQLWEMRDRDRRQLTYDSYQRIGGIAGALASHADAVVAECSAREQTVVRALFLRLVTPERTRAIVPVRELYELSPDASEVHRVVDRLVRSRLLVGQTVASETGATSAGGTVELVHESLIHSWPLLRRWLDETQEDAAFLEQLRNAAKQWQTRGYAQGLLWRGEAMQEAKLWRSRYRGELPDLQRAYLDAVFSLSARATRRKRLAVIAAMGFLSALVIAGGVGIYMIRNAQQEATAQARRVAEQLTLTQAAEQTAKAEHAKTAAANLKLETQNTQLLAAIDAANRARQESERARTEAERAQAEAEAARQRAEQSKRHERRSRRKATEAAAAAEAAAAEAKRASAQAESLLEQERKRVKELEQLTRGAKIISDVTLD